MLGLPWRPSGEKKKKKKNLLANAGDTGSIPNLRRSHMLQRT